MPLVIPADYFECAMTHQLDGSLRPAVCTIGVWYVGADLNGDFAELADIWALTLVQSMADVWTYTNFTARDATGTVYVRGESTEGGTAHTPATSNTAFLIRKRTLFGGRANQGRWYVPGVSEQDVDGAGVLAGSKITELEANIENWVVGCVSHNFFPVILHNTNTIIPTAIDTFHVESLVATQRRRMRK